MTSKLLLSFGLVLAGAGLASAQTTTQPPPSAPASTEPAAINPPLVIAETAPPPPSEADHPPLPGLSDPCSCGKLGPRFWVSSEYLLWWVKKGPVDAPLLTFNPSNGTAAALTDPGTQVLLGPGGQGLSYGGFSGGRVTAGGWLDSCEQIGLEASGFLLERRPFTLLASSSAPPRLGNPVNFTVPFGGLTPGEAAFTNGNGAAIPEIATVQSSSQLWGAEVNGLLNLTSSDRWHIHLLAGLRYLDLAENLRLTENFSDVTTSGSEILFDSFQTRNQFYGGQVGTRIGFTFRKLSAELTTLLALGENHEVLSINGSTTVTNGAFGFPTGTFPGGVYADVSNIGRFNRDVFSVVPEARLQLGYDVTSRLRALVGYNFLYVNNVMRPGNQVDRNLNANQNYAGNFAVGTTPVFNTPPNQPGPLLQRSDFWAQGVSFGLEFRF